MLSKHLLEMKSWEMEHLYMPIFHKSKYSKSKPQNKNEFDFISLSIITNVNEFFFMAKRNFLLCLIKRALK